MIVGMVVYNWDWSGKDPKPFHAVKAGLERIGHTVRCCIPPGDGLTDCEAIFVWNAQKREWYRDMAAEFIANGVRVFVMERGWLDRYKHTQIDPLGFNHTASWSHELSHEAPQDGVGRYQSICKTLSPRTRKRVECRQTGYVLILGQTGGDTQLKHSEIHHPDALCGAVVASLPAGLEAKYRRHPLSKVEPKCVESLQGSLDDALAGARFVITINSNSGNDALWAGIPVLCFGPALYEYAGVAHSTCIARLLPDMEFMCRGWHPDERLVLRYFHWLASKQWSHKELEQGDCLKQLLGENDGED